MAKVISCDCPTGKKEPATIEVDTSGCSGDGPLTAEASNEKEETFEVKVQEGESGKYTLSFSPPCPDVYTLSIKWGDVHVEHSPLRLNLNSAQSKEVMISEPPGGNIKPGEKIIIGFDASKAGRGELTSTCSADDSGDIPVDVIRTGFTSHYVVDFLPPHEDFYTLYVRWSGKNVKGSPFKLDMIPVLPNRVVASNIKVPVPGGLIEMDICTKGAGNAGLTATCKGDETGDIPVKLDKLSQYDYHLTAAAGSEPDTYHIDVKFAGQCIPDSPFTVKVTPPASADKVDHLSTTVQDEAVTLKFDASKAGEGTFRARVAGIDSGPVDCNHEPIPPNEEAQYQVVFNPMCADSYLVDVYWNDDPVPDSPFNVIILRPELLKFGEPKFVELDHPVELPADASKAGPGTLTATCKGENCGEVETFVEETEEHSKKHTINFRPSEYDTYTLSVFFDGVEVPQSPFVIPVENPEPESDTPKYFLFGVSKRKMFNIGEKITVGVNASKAGEGRLNVTISGPSATGEEQPQVSVQSSEEDPQIYHVEFVPTACGEHRIHLQWDEETIPGSPVAFTIGDDTDVPTHPITKPYKIFFTTETDPKDIRSFGVHEESELNNDLTTGYRRNGKMKLTYNATQLGIHSLHVLIDDQEVPGSPWRVRFVESDPKACGILDVPEVAYVGEEVSFTVDARKAGHGDLHVRARVPPGGGSTNFSHQDHNNGFYTILFSPKVTGTHQFDISWAGTPLSDSPVTIEAKRRDGSLQDAQRAAEVHVLKEDYHVFEKALPYSSPAYLCVSTGHAGGKGKLSFRATGPSEAKISVIDRENGVYTAEVQPVVAGKYTIGILWNDIHIKDSPFKLNFTEEKSYLLNGLDLDNVPFVMDVPYSFHIHCPQKESEQANEQTEKKGELSVTCTPTTAAEINLKPLEHDSDSYVCEIIPKEVGNHEISIKYNDRDVHNSPHYVQFEPNPDTAEQAEDHLSPLDVSIDMNAPISQEAEGTDQPEDQGKVRVFGEGLSDGLVGQEGHFTIETEKAGEGKLEVDVQGPKGAFKINIRRHPENPRTLLAQYDPKVVGKYTIHVLWEGEHVSQSPYTVNISEQVVQSNEADETENNETNEAEPEDKTNETEPEDKETETEEKTNENETAEDDANEKETESKDDKIDLPAFQEQVHT